MWSYAAAIAVFATAAGCNGGSRPEAGTNEPTTTLTTAASPLDVTVTAEPSSVPAGGRLRITVIARNTSSAAIALEFTSGCQTDYELLDAAGTLVGASGEMCTQATTRRTLAAGESFNDVHVWIRGLAGMPQVPGSELQVRGMLLATGNEIRSGRTARVELP